jgi:uncharacterized protein YbjT (DUF2867 family)
MMPSTSLTQGGFAEFDLYLADNFSRACHKNGVKKLIYLSGIIPDEKNLSPHLKSRLEVEKTLAQYQNNLTVLRAGLIIGKNGSSFHMMEKLIYRLPALICPKWTQRKNQPIDLKDVMASLIYSIDHSQSLNQVYDIAGPDVVTYETMLRKTADVLKKKRYFFNVPFFSPKLSKLWVSIVGSTSMRLVSPLVDSLKHQMIANPAQQLVIKEHQYIKVDDSLKNGLAHTNLNWVREVINYNSKININWLKNVTSIQKIPLVNNMSAEDAANHYFNWLPNFLKPFFKVEVNKNVVFFICLKYFKLINLKKSPERSTPDRVVYYITGGLLANSKTYNGRFEFRSVPSSSCILACLLDFRPALPWFIYKYTQALIHLFVMNRFKKYLSRIDN